MSCSTGINRGGLKAGEMAVYETRLPINAISIFAFFLDR